MGSLFYKGSVIFMYNIKKIWPHGLLIVYKMTQFFHYWVSFFDAGKWTAVIFQWGPFFFLTSNIVNLFKAKIDWTLHLPILIYGHPVICNILRTLLSDFMARISLRKGIRVHVSMNVVNSRNHFHSFSSLNKHPITCLWFIFSAIVVMSIIYLLLLLSIII